MFAFEWDAHTLITKMILGVNYAVYYPEYRVMARVIDNLGKYVIPFVAVPDSMNKGFTSEYDLLEGWTILQCIGNCKVSSSILDRRLRNVRQLSSLCYTILIMITKSMG